SARAEDVFDAWIDRYSEATQRPPFRTLREIQPEILGQVLHSLGVDADAAPYVELFFEATTKVELYPEVPEVLRALGAVRTAIVSNADSEHIAAWSFSLPVEFIVISESIRAYKPDPLVFRTALERLGLEAHEVLHVGDSDVDDVKGAKAAGLRVAWLNREGRPRRPAEPCAHQRAVPRDVGAAHQLLRRRLLVHGFRQLGAVDGVDEAQRQTEDVERQVAQRALALGRHVIHLTRVEARDERLRGFEHAIQP